MSNLAVWLVEHSVKYWFEPLVNIQAVSNQ